MCSVLLLAKCPRSYLNQPPNTICTATKKHQRDVSESIFLGSHYQVYKADRSAHILACAPSNSACDLLCERLMVHMDHHRVYRLYASSRDPRTVPKSLLVSVSWPSYTPWDYLVVSYWWWIVSKYIWAFNNLIFIKLRVMNDLVHRGCKRPTHSRKICHVCFDILYFSHVLSFIWLFQKHCNWDQRRESFVFPDKESLMEYTVVVTTLISAGR